MEDERPAPKKRLSIIVPAYNEERTLRRCVERVLAIADPLLDLEILIVDDASRDRTAEVSLALAAQSSSVRVFRHDVNQGKGAALHTGIRHATGDFVAVQDADLEYDPRDLKKLIVPLCDGTADVVIGSRFLSGGAHRVFYFWHSVGNRFLTVLSNMFTDLTLTDMETCYKVFRREIIQQIDLKEKRFGFEPEVVAKIAQLRVRVFEIGISYAGRTYEEGKKIGARDGFRALYCIARYNLPHAPMPMQFLAYLFIGGVCAVFNVLAYLALATGFSVVVAAGTAFVLAAALNYWLCVKTIFRHRTRWSSGAELALYLVVVAVAGGVDVLTTAKLVQIGLAPALAKSAASAAALIFNFLGRRWLVFAEKPAGPWKPATG